MIEDLHTEFKAVWKKEYLRNVAALANTDGGVIYIGYSDKGELIGLNDVKKPLKQIPDDIQNVFGIIPTVDWHSEDGKDYITIDVSKNEDGLFYDGKFFVKSGSTTRELKGRSLRTYLLKRFDLSWSEDVTERVSITDLDNGILSDFKKQALMYGGLTESESRLSVKDLFNKLELSEDGNPKLAAVLLFDPEPQRFTEGAAVQIGMFDGPDILFQDYLKGPLFTMPDRIVDLLFTKYMKAPITFEGLHRKENAPYPREAIRESVLNAVIHSDYGDKVAIQIKVFADRITIYNSGSPPNGWTMDTLLSSHRSYPGNPTMAQVFHRAGMVEKFGRGIEKIMDQYDNRGAKIPEFRFDGSEFSVTLFDENFNPDTKYTLGNGLSERESQLYRMIADSRFTTSSDVASEMDISVISVSRTLSSLVDKGLIERVGSKKSGHWIIKK